MARMAVLVDGDNISARHAPRLHRIAEAQGTPDVWRVYMDTSCRKDWHEVHGVRLVHAGCGKNGADILLSVEAMEMALQDGIGSFVIASSDGDFAPLALRLRERGLRVIGAGEAKTPEAFRAACTRFEEIGPQASQPPVTDLDRKIRTMIATHSKNGEGMQLNKLAPKMHASHGVRISTLPDGSWRAYLSRRCALYDLDPRGPEARVRFRPDGFRV